MIEEIQNSIKGLKDEIEKISPKVEQKERKTDNGREDENIK